MIPTIEQIIEDLLAGAITKQQAVGWLHQHAEDAGRWLRDDFAAAALTGFLANSFNDGENKPLSHAGRNEIASMAYAQADAMLARRGRAS